MLGSQSDANGAHQPFRFDPTEWHVTGISGVINKPAR
jgi:hypothetical protein